MCQKFKKKKKKKKKKSRIEKNPRASRFPSPMHQFFAFCTILLFIFAIFGLGTCDLEKKTFLVLFWSNDADDSEKCNNGTRLR
jgi:hypothetical protein